MTNHQRDLLLREISIKHYNIIILSIHPFYIDDLAGHIIPRKLVDYLEIRRRFSVVNIRVYYNMYNNAHSFLND